jgi:competence protein ComEA
MNENEDKKQIIIPIIAFLIGVLLGSIITLLIFPNDCPECICKDQISEISIEERETPKSSTEQIVLEQSPIVSDKTVSLPTQECNIVVDIAGAVKEPGVYCFNQGSRVVDVIERAKGFDKGVAYKYVAMKMNLASLIDNYQKIYIPYEEDVYCELKNLQYIDAQETSQQQDNTGNNTSDSTQTCININSATKEQLTTLDGIGESTAQKIIDARPFEKVEDILNVSGIGEATYEKFKNDICVY